ncbi:MAG: polyribonucleotide nucleotidyltransferase [Synergistales bacterium]|nr:polyribonucleotide nucleotidyltransferase [Synergistales bacterium]
MKRYEVEVGGRALSFETGKLARQASGAVHCTYGDTVVLMTTCVTKKPREGLDFFPLLVDYEERFYSAGKIPGGFIKREGKPSDTAILSARMIDRSIRSLFPQHMRHDVHVVATVHSVDQENPPNVVAINGASFALMLSEIPWAGPIGAVRIGYINGGLVLNPTETEMEESELDLLVAGHSDGITMVESGGVEIPEHVMVDALEMAHAEIKKICALQEQMRAEMGKPKLEIPAPERNEEIDSYIEENCYEDIVEAVKIHDKGERGDAIAAIGQKVWEVFRENAPEAEKYIESTVEDYVKKAMRALILDKGFRSDGRTKDQVRDLTCETGVLPRTHGSALFTRGETQSLAVTTLGMMGEDDQILDGLKHDEEAKSFTLHYNFPPYSVGEVKPMRGPGRREIGHGALAERAIKSLLPDSESFPYVIRVVSDILESNGSSSMASVCGASMSLMDAGVPVSAQCAGIAMGMIKEGDRVAILTDIQGLEDHYGDMDFKVAGTEKGITALQMDNKAGGITREILEEALGQAREARMHILETMNEAISSPKEALSTYAPRITRIKVNPEKIRDIIGPGGKTIRNIVQQSGAKVDVEDDGHVYVSSTSQEAAQAALDMIHDLVRDVEPGEIFVGKVQRLISFGAFVEVLPGKEGLLHVSEISTHHVNSVDDIFSVGDTVLVKVREIDDLGRVNLTRKKALQDSRVTENSESYSDILAQEQERDVKIEELAAKAPKEKKRPPRNTDDKRQGGGRSQSGGRDRDRRGGGGNRGR